MGSYSSAKGIKTFLQKNPLGTVLEACSHVRWSVHRSAASSEEPPRFRVDYWSKDCTLFCPLALGLSGESCLLHLELRLQEFEVFGPAFCFWSHWSHSQVIIQGHLLSSVRHSLLHPFLKRRMYLHCGCLSTCNYVTVDSCILSA